LIAPQAQHALQPQRTGARLQARHPPHRPKPCGQRCAGILEDCSCGHRRLPPTRGTLQQQCDRPSLGASTSRAAEPLGPSQVHQIRPARLLRRKPALELRLRSRIILHACRHYRLGAPESNG
jgi:hypothetical protein